MLALRHPDRDNAYDEAETCIAMQKDSSEIIRKQMERYRREGDAADNGFTANGIIFRKHDDKKLAEVMEAWWEEICNGSKRDQLSFGYACWKHGFAYDASELNCWKSDYRENPGTHKFKEGMLTKYDVEVDMDNHDSHTWVLKQVGQGSKVLEFGPANGGMTKFMHEQLGCKVYIVEKDPDGFNAARKHAADAICGDIMDFEWMEWADVGFDYILFADVLEHLNNPQLVLKKAREILIRNGSVLVSIPNIAHNDVIIKLLNNKFDYTDIGLLDDTHIHFFAKNNLEKFVVDAGYQIVDLQYIKIPMWQTEQFRNKRLTLDKYVENMLNEREFGDVYQFLMRLEKADQAKEHIEVNKYFSGCPVIEGKIYFDRGSGFTEKDMQNIDAINIGKEKYRLACQFSDLKDVVALRYDPVEEQGCIITKSCIKQGGKELNTEYSSHLAGNSGVILLGTDPTLIVHIDDGGDDVFWEVEFIIEGKAFTEVALRNFQDRQDDYLQINYKTDALNDQLGKAQSEIDGLKKENEQLSSDFKAASKTKDKQIEGISRKLQEQKEITEAKDRQISDIDRELQEQKEITEAKDRQISDIDRELQEQKEITEAKDRQISDIDRELQEQKEICCALDARITKMESTMSWRLTKVFRVVGNKLRIK